MREDAHLDTPELGDYVEFTVSWYGNDVTVRGVIEKFTNRGNCVTVLADDGKLYRGLYLSDLTVLGKAA